MRKSVIAFLTMLTLALGLVPAFALAAPGGGLSVQDEAKATITFEAGANGDLAQGAITTLTKGAGETVTAAERPAVTANSGYEFDKWTVKVGQAEATDVTSWPYTVPSGAEVITFTANFRTAQQNVKFIGVKTAEDNATVELGEVAVASGTKVSEVAIPALKNYTQDGTDVYTAADLKDANKVEADATVTADGTYYVKLVGKTYTVAYDLNSVTGTVPDNGVIVYNGKVQATDAQGKYIWEKAGAADKTTDVADANAPETGYTKKMVGATLKIAKLSDAAALVAATVESTETGFYYKFTGWNTKANGSGTAYEADKELSNTDLNDDTVDIAENGTLTLYAQWDKVWKVDFATQYGSPKPADQYVAATYEQKADENDATKTVDDLTKPVGAKVEEPAALTSTGHDFKGWNKADGTKFDFAADTVKGSTTLTADWATAEYTVSFVTGTADKIDPVTVTYNTEYTVTATLPIADKDGKYPNDKVGYTFAGWYTDEDFKTQFTTGKITKDTPLYAKWTANEYTVKFDKNKPAKASTDEEVAGTTADVKFTYENIDTEKLTKNGYSLEGYLFLGWAKTPTGAIEYDDEAAIDEYLIKTATDAVTDQEKGTTAKTVTLYARWSAQYKVVFNANKSDSDTDVYTQQLPVNGGGNFTAFEDMKIDGATNAIENEHYTFDSWNTERDGSGTKYDNKAAYTNNTATDGEVALTLYAQWKGETYKVTYDANGADGDAPAAQSLQYDTKVQKTDENGVLVWDVNGTETPSATKPAGDNVTAVMVYATADVPGYTTDKTFKLEKPGYRFMGWSDEATDAKVEIYKQTNVSAPTNQDKVQFTNEPGKSETALKTLDKNITLKAQWAARTFKVVYNDGATDGAKLAEGKTAADKPKDTAITYDSETPVTVAANPYEKLGYEAKGWIAYKADTNDADGTFFVDKDGAKTTDPEKYVKVKEYADGATMGTTDVASDVILCVNWVAKKFPVEFYAEDGTTLLGSYDVAYDEFPEFTKDVPTKEDAKLKYEFAGWKALTGNAQTKDKVVGGIDYDVDRATFERTVVNAKLDVATSALLDLENKVETAKLVATFDEGDAQKYAVVFVAEGLDKVESMPKDEVVTYGGTISKEAAAAKPTADGYTFDGWYADAAFATAFDFANAVEGNTTVYAKFTATEETTKVAAAAAAEATALANSVVVSEKGDGSDVATDKQWATAEQKAAIEAAAKAVTDAGANVTPAQIAALNDAVAAVNANGKGADASKAEASAADKAAADQALTDAEKLLADAKAGKETLTSAEQKALEDAIAAYKAADPKTTAATQAITSALSTAKTAAQKAAEAKANDGKKDTAKKQTLKASTKKVNAKAKTLKKKKVVVKASKAFKVTGAKTKVTYKKVKANKQNKKFAVAKNGKITLKKGLKKGTYSLKIKATAAAGNGYASATKTFTVKIKVK